MSRLGWRDIGMRQLKQLKAQSGLAERDDIVTMMDYFEVDEGRLP